MAPVPRLLPEGMKVLHLSDVHLAPVVPGRRPWHGGWRRLLAQVELQLMGRARRYAKAPEALARILEEAAELEVDHLVLSGDLTVLARDEEFALVAESLGALTGQPARLTVVPGNHDRYTPGSHRDRRFERHFAGLLASDLPEYQVLGAFPLVRLVGDDLAVVGLDSTQVPPFPGLAFGRVGTAQRQALAALLDDDRLAGRSVLVTFHHAPYDHTGRPELWTHGLHDADAVLDLCAAKGVAAVLHGHVHHRYRRACPRTGVEIFGAGSSTEAGNEGYWLLELEGGRVIAAEALTPTVAGEAALAV